MTATSRILVVDDDPAILSTVKEFLQLEGYGVQTATNGAEALAVLKTRNHSLILLDMRLPLLDGWEVARRIHEDPRRPPIVVMTVAQSARLWAQEIEAEDYLAKPVDLADLLAVVTRHRRADH